MTFTSTREGIRASSLETILRGLAPDGGLFVPESIPAPASTSWSTLEEAQRAALATFFGDIPEAVRDAATRNLLSKFPEGDPVPLVPADGWQILELFHGPTGAFKDVALSVLPVLMREAARAQGAKRVLVLTATSGDTGSAAMAGFAGVAGTDVAVFFPETGTSRVQRLQMTTPAAANVHAFAIRGNFDDAQAAVKRIFGDAAFRAEAAGRGVHLSSANSINTGRLVPQIAYYLHTAARLGCEFDVAVPSGNFGNILAAYYAKRLGAPIGRFICASNVNDVLARFISTGTYDPGAALEITNSPSMDILKSSNVERLLWLVNSGDGKEVTRLMEELSSQGRYTLKPDAFARLREEFEGASATIDETEAAMRETFRRSGYVLDPHTAVAVCAARKLGYPKHGRACVVAATATPYKFPETCLRAYGRDLLENPPPSFKDLEARPVTQNTVIDVSGIDDAVRGLF